MKYETCEAHWKNMSLPTYLYFTIHQFSAELNVSDSKTLTHMNYYHSTEFIK